VDDEAEDVGGGKREEDVEAERLELEYRFRTASGCCCDVVGACRASRENRLGVASANPASWSDRMRSAMLTPPPDEVLWSVPFVLGRVSGVAEAEVVGRTHVVIGFSSSSNLAVRCSTLCFKLLPSCYHPR
jgi:hypothetical protein